MTVWQSPSNPPVIDKSKVHIWRANLNFSPAEVVRLTAFLSTDEIARANKFRFPQHKRRFIAARSILRQLLSNYLNISPNNIKFDYGDRGKPKIIESNTANSLQFNISHSQEYALFGFTTSNLIGVDLEYLREMPDAVKIAQRFFSPREFDLIKNLTPQQQSQVFFKLWTAKEAYLKAIGIGLSGSLSSVDIDFTLDNNNTLILAINGNTTIANNWSMYSCIPSSNYVGAIAIKTQIAKQQIDFWSWH
ncbi:MAG: 4'-phosphopantetheinyl transferase family protein [Pleurocapsa sp.]